MEWARLDDIFEAALPRINEICDLRKLVDRADLTACPDFPPEPSCSTATTSTGSVKWRLGHSRTTSGVCTASASPLPTDGFLLSPPEVSGHETLDSNSAQGPWKITHLHSRILKCMPTLRAWAIKFFPHQKTFLDVSQSVAGQSIDIKFTHNIEGKRHLALVISFEPGRPQVQFKYPEGYDPSDW